MSGPPTDLQLIEQARAGNEDALIALHARYASLVYSVAYRVLNDSMAAEEATQDTFMRVWRKIDVFDASRGSFVAWLLTITRRIAIDMFRKLRRDPLVDIPSIDDNPERWEKALGIADSDELHQNMKAALKSLPDAQRQAIELAYFYGLTHSEIAEVLREPLGTIKTRIRLGMDKLRTEWLTETAR